MKKNKNIKCNVKSCEHNNEDCCCLKDIKIACTSNCNEAQKDETVCDSFKEKNS